MSVASTIVIAQMASFIKAMTDTPKVQLRYMRTELGRGVKRIRKSFIKAQLSGSPGIKATKLAKGKNVFTYVAGSSLDRLGAKIGLSRILHVHDKGMTIRPKEAGGKLYLHESGGVGAKGRGPIVAVVPEVVIPARLHFVAQVEREAPAMLLKVAQAGARATHDTLSKGLLQGARV